MKKFYSLVLIIVATLSCVFLSACGNKYKNLSISFYSSRGENISAVEFLLDRSKQDFEYPTQTIGIQFDGIKQKDLGQVQVFSEPYELTEVSNYRVNGNMVFVDVRANMASTNARLTAVHMSSGKKQSVPLVIEQKSASLSVNQSLTYIISIPESTEELVMHSVDMRKLVSLYPGGSTDKLFFKTNSNLPLGVDLINVTQYEEYKELEGAYENVYSGFKVTSNVQHGETITVYPVTYLKGYENPDIDEFRQDASKQITIKFLKTLKNSNVTLTSTISTGEYEVESSILNPLKLITNDSELKSIVVEPKLKNGDNFIDLNNGDYLANYSVDAASDNDEILSAHVDAAQNNVIITSYLAENVNTVTISLLPKNSVGDIAPVYLKVIAKGLLKADVIKVMKDKNQVSTLSAVDILDYYSNNVPGTLFNFVSATQIGANVDSKLDDMQIVIDKRMLSSVNNGLGEYTHALEFYLLGDVLKFEEIEYDKGLEGVTYVAAPINSFSNVYIKYVKTESSTDEKLKIDVRTVSEFDHQNDNSLHFNGNEITNISVAFNLVAGVKTASVQAGTFTANSNVYKHFDEAGQINPQYIYLNKAMVTEGSAEAYYLHIVNDSLLDRMDVKITGKLALRAEIKAVGKNISNPLKIVNGFKAELQDDNKYVTFENPSNIIKFEHDNTKDNDVVGLVIDNNTQVGEYELSFYQENNKISTLTIFVYETLAELQEENIELSQNNQALVENDSIFKNTYEDYVCDYIVAVGQKLDLSVTLQDNIKNSNFKLADDTKQNIVAEYEFSIDKTKYATKVSGEKNACSVEFIKGSMGESKEYVTLTITVHLNTFSNILTPSVTDAKTYDITFFVFEKVEQKDASLSKKELFKQPNDMVGYYFAENAQDVLSIVMDEEKWKYVSMPQWKVENSNGGYITGRADEQDPYKYSIVCNSSISDYTSLVKVSFTQFGRTFEYSCLVHVDLPVLTERIVVNSEVLLTDDEHQTPYINIKDGETYQLKAEQISSFGDVTNKGLIVVVVDEKYSQAYSSNYFVISDLNSTITVKTVDNSHKFKLLVLPKDLLPVEINSKILFKLNNQGEFEFSYSITGANNEQNTMTSYLSTYFMVDIILSNGTKENPYLIKTAKELFKIDDSLTLLSSHYQLQTSLNLSGYEALMPIKNFSGSITTHGNNIYNIDGLTLDAANKNLFTNFSGEMFGISFGVKYNYNLSIASLDEGIYLGVLDKTTTYAKLENVFVSINASIAKFEYQGQADYVGVKVYFGGLVGDNAGTINYVNEKNGKTYENIIGVYGNITLEESSKSTAGIVFGGLVGNNTGAIIGALDQSNFENNEIVFATSNGTSHAMSNINIVSSLKNENSTIGGVIGFNTNNGSIVGSIKNAYVQANIQASSTNNVGGVIGKNNSGGASIKITNTSIINLPTEPEDFVNIIQNIKSASVVIGKNYVGGITGFDVNGYYYDCDFQVLDVTSNNQTAISGERYVGGMVGKSTSGKFLFCSVMSYVWDYKNLLNQEFTAPDIYGTSNVGGLVGQIKSSKNNISTNNGNVDGDLARLVVAHSSANAYVRSNSSVGGLLTLEEGQAIIFNSYFLGKLEGNYAESKLSDYDSNPNNEDKGIHFISSYAVNVTNVSGVNEFETQISSSLAGLDIKNPTLNYWWQNAGLNAGYIFVTKDVLTGEENENHVPIFDVAPSSIEVTAKADTKDLRLEYYDFSIDSRIDETTLTRLNNEKNKMSLKSVLDFVVKPAGIGTVVIKAISSNSQVVDISVGGELIINGIGACTLTFVSVLDNNVKASIDVKVEYPIGNFKIGTSAMNLDKIVDTEFVGKGTSRQYYMITTGKYSFTNANGTTSEYKYRTLLNANLEVSIVASNGDIESISKYVSSSGKKLSEFLDEENGNCMKVVYQIDAGAPFVISIKEQLENNSIDHFIITVKPYYMEGEDLKYYQYTTIVDGEEENTDCSYSFNLYTMAGVTGVTTSYNKSVVYLNDTVTINLQFASDIKFIDGLINSIYDWDYGNILASYAGVTLSFEYVKNVIGEDGKPTVVSLWDELRGHITIKVAQYDASAHTLTLELEFDKQIDFKANAEKQFDLRIEIENTSKVEKIEYTLLSQRINRIDIKNYYYEKGEKVLYDILKATEENAGLIIIDMVPENAYFDYLEISDITGDEEIVFIQLKEENGTTVNTAPDVSKDGKGIKLYRYDGMITGRIFVKTQISNDYSSKEHIIEVRAYMSNGTMIASQRKIIDVKMLPSAKIEYINPDGSYHSNIAHSDEGQNPTLALANGASATLRITTKNTTQEFAPIISGELANKFSLVSVAGDLYELRRSNVDLDTADIGKTISITIEAYSFYDVGSYELATCTMNFRITNFVIHSVSVNQSIDNNTTKEIYGYFNKSLKLEFYFSKTDISYYDISAEQPFHSAIYRNTNSVPDDDPNDDSTLEQIYRVLYALNNPIANENVYLKLQSLINGNYIDYVWNNSNAEQANPLLLEGNTLTVKEGYNKDIYENVERYLAVEFSMFNEANDGIEVWEIQPYETEYELSDNYYKNSKHYKLNFREVTQWDDPDVVANEEDFLNMTSGGNYILKRDLVLRDYSPLDVALDQFDGNGFTITIQSFAEFNEVDIYAGLFQKIYSTMTVKNVMVKYETQLDDAGNYTLGAVGSSGNTITYYDLCNNPNVAYTSARFGGIAALNYGVITNCKVQGQVALRASIVEQSTEGNSTYSSQFYIGGVVAENTTDEFGEYGYITHSNTELKIFALANIGGFAYSNTGKIASSGVDNQATIYAYNQNLSNTLVVEVAGFVVNNTNEISMSYVELQAGQVALLSSKYGTISAKDTSAGFVYTNSGKISDSYVVLSESGVNNNKFYGFVASNMGSIYRSYTYINGGQVPSKGDVMFADQNTQNIFNSIQFIVNSSAANVVEGVTILNPLNYLGDINAYEKVGFTFSNDGAVWMEQYGLYPKLKSTTEKVENPEGLLNITGDPSYEDGVDKTNYKVDYSTYGTPQNPFIITSLEDWNTFFNPSLHVAMTGYYRIVRDIRFGDLGYYPLTSEVTFSGNIEGNNMELSDIMLYSTESLESIGLFKKLEGTNDSTIKNEVRNLTLEASSVWASNTNAVGILAGIVENFEVYNITIKGDADLVVVGKNAVGGLAGLVTGYSSVNQIDSNVSVNSTRASTQNTYSVYMSKNNSLSYNNLKNVYYAGAVAGILDLYSSGAYNINQDRSLNDNYYVVQNISIKSNSFVAVGDTVGVAFGFIGEQVKLVRANIEVGGSIMGAQYSAGLVGENRGIIQNSTVIIQDDTFTNANNVVGGVVGLNMGGLIQNSTAQFNMVKHSYDFTVGGIVGRNLFGTVVSSHYDGNILSYYTGGIIGANYDDETMMSIQSGTGAFGMDNKVNVNNQQVNNVVPNVQVKYYDEQGNFIANLTQVSISLNAFDNMLENAKKCYSYQTANKEITSDDLKLSHFISKSRVLGVVVGISSFENHEINVVDAKESEEDEEFDLRWRMTLNHNKIIFNNGEPSLTIEGNREVIVGNITESDAWTTIKFKDVNMWYDERMETPQIMFLVGAVATSMNSWSEYSDCYILVGQDLTKE